MKKYLSLCILCLPLIFACGSDNPVVSQDQILGSWIQESSNEFILDINNRFLTLTFRADGTFEIIIVTGRLSGNPITDTLNGTYVLSGFQLTTTFSDGTRNIVSVKIENNRMIFEDAQGNVSVYRK